jgi:hypothetical protein
MCNLLACGCVSVLWNREGFDGTKRGFWYLSNHVNNDGG